MQLLVFGPTIYSGGMKRLDEERWEQGTAYAGGARWGRPTIVIGVKLEHQPMDSGRLQADYIIVTVAEAAAAFSWFYFNR